MTQQKDKSPVADTDDEEGEVITGPPTPPDGGWGWVVMLASFTISILVDGVCLNLGVLFPYFLDYFQESKGRTSIAGSVLNGTYLLAGPVTSALANRFGCRKVTIAGALVSSAAFFLATFSPTVDVLILLYGAIAGFGFGLMYLPAIVMVGYYFEAKRALATGVAVCGSGIGLFVFAPITEKLLQEYSWKGALWVISALVLHGLVCGAAYRPLPPTITRKTNSSGDTELEQFNTKSAASITQPNVGITPAKPDQRRILGSGSLVQPDGPVSRGRTLSEECIVKAVQNSSSATASSDTAWVHRLTKSQDVSALSRHRPSKHPHRDAQKLFRPLDRKDIFYSGSIPNLREFQSSASVEDYERKVTKSHLKEGPEPNTQTKHCLKCFADTTKVFRDMLDISLLSRPSLLIYLTSCFLVMFGFFVPFTFVPVLAEDLGINKINAALLISILGITNTVGRIISGLLSDRPQVDCVLFNNATIIFGGIITLVVPFLSSFTHLAVYTAFYGFSISPFVSLRSVILVELLGLDKLTNGFGLVIFAQGLSSYLGPPIAGALSDSYGNYNAAFYFAGTAFLASGLICLPLRKLSRWEKRRKSVSLEEKTAEEISKLV